MDNGAANGIVWGKWVALAALVIAVVIIVTSIRFYSVRRVQQGHDPIPGTGWMGLPEYTAAQTDREGLPEVAAPAYNPTVGDDDAGFYDKDGNFIARPAEAQLPQDHDGIANVAEGIVLQPLPVSSQDTGHSSQTTPPPHVRSTPHAGIDSPPDYISENNVEDAAVERSAPGASSPVASDNSSSHVTSRNRDIYSAIV